jgi:hypothetical protein
MTPKDATDPTADLVGGGYLVRFESRTLDDIRAFGGNTQEDERKFAAAARVSDINLGLYKTLWQPWVKMFANAGNADMMRRMHQARLPYEMFKADSPIWRTLDPLIENAKSARQPVAPNNPFWQAQKMYSDWIISTLDGYRDVRDKMQEEWFHAVYGSPIVQAMLGLSGSDTDVRPKPATDINYQKLVEHRIEELKANMAVGGPVEAALRALLYIRIAEGAADERSFALFRRMRQEAGKGLPIRAFKKMLREQFFMLMIDERGALDAIPEMLARDPEVAADMEKKLDRMIEALGLQNPEAKERYKEIRALVAQPHTPRGHIEKASTVSPRVHVLPGSKGSGPRRPI